MRESRVGYQVLTMHKKVFFVFLIVVSFLGGGLFLPPGPSLASAAELCEPCCEGTDCASDFCAGAGTGCDVSAGKNTGLCKSTTGITFCSPLGRGGGKTKIGELIDRITSWMLKVAFVVAPVMIIIAGVLFYKAAGNPSKIGLANRIVLWTVVGFLLILFSNAIGSIIDYILGR